MQLDAQQGSEEIEVELSVNEDVSGPPEADRDAEAERNATPRTRVPEQIRHLLSRAGFRRMLAGSGAGGPGIILQMGGEEGEEDDDDMFTGLGGLKPARRRRSQACNNDKFPPVPNPNGKSLMDSGTFGHNGYYRDRRVRKTTILARDLMSREHGTIRHDPKRVTSAIAQVRLIMMQNE